MAEGFVRVKMSWARERSGYLAYCGSEPMMMALDSGWEGKKRRVEPRYRRIETEQKVEDVFDENC